MWVSVRLQSSDPVVKNGLSKAGGKWLAVVSEFAPLMYSAAMSSVASFIVIHAAWT